MNTGDFDLNNFLQKKKKKKMPDIAPYLELKNLKGFKQITTDNMNKLIPRETYVKYIKNSNLFMDDKLDTHVKGGILVSGGTTYNKESYEKLDNPYKWTHIVLTYTLSSTKTAKTDTRSGDKKIDEDKQIIFRIKINDCYLFYKHFVPK